MFKGEQLIITPLGSIASRGAVKREGLGVRGDGLWVTGEQLKITPLGSIASRGTVNRKSKGK